MRNLCQQASYAIPGLSGTASATALNMRAVLTVLSFWQKHIASGLYAERLAALCSL